MNYELRIKRRGRRKGLKLLSFLVGILICGSVYIFFFRGESGELWSENKEKTVTVTLGGVEFPVVSVSEKTVGAFLLSNKIMLGPGDSVFPSEETALFSGTHIVLVRAHEMTVAVDGGQTILHTQAETVGRALSESDIAIDEDDIVKPSRDTFAENGIKVVITRVQIEEEIVEKPIAFEKKANEDSSLSWRKMVVTQKGENGIQKLTYKVSKYDGKEVNRKLLHTEVIKEPVPQIVTQGTLVKLGKSHTGGASWYAWTGTMAAANPWLPKGSYVKVTNLENGKSVIVVINDRGPFVPGRIIDLDKVAFQKIASIGAGVITVKMEEIVN